MITLNVRSKPNCYIVYDYINLLLPTSYFLPVGYRYSIMSESRPKVSPGLMGDSAAI